MQSVASISPIISPELVSTIISSAKPKDILVVLDYAISGDFQKSREKQNYEKIDNMMKIADSMKGSINIISSDHEGGKKLDGLGGIAAILRYKLNY